MMDCKHRKSLHRFEQFRHWHELTFSCYRRIHRLHSRQPRETRTQQRATDFTWSSARFHEFEIVDPQLPQLIRPAPE